MERKDFIKKGIFATALTYLYNAVTSPLKAAEKIAASPYRGVEAVLAPANTHMVGNGFKVMNYFPNGRGFE